MRGGGLKVPTTRLVPRATCPLPPSLGAFQNSPVGALCQKGRRRPDVTGPSPSTVMLEVRVSALGSGRSSGHASVLGGAFKWTAQDLVELLLPPARLGPACASQHRDAITWCLLTRVTGRFLCTCLYTSTSSGHPCDNVTYVLCCVGRNGLRFMPCPGSGPSACPGSPCAVSGGLATPRDFGCCVRGQQARLLFWGLVLTCCVVYFKGFFPYYKSNEYFLFFISVRVRVLLSTLHWTGAQSHEHSDRSGQRTRPPKNMLEDPPGGPEFPLGGWI